MLAHPVRQRSARHAARPDQSKIVRRIAKLRRSICVRSRAPLHRNIRVERTPASHRKAHEWAAFHISGSRGIIFAGRQTNNAIVAHFITEGPNP
jgi:hypothetical protein